jgi:hypothetical protein
MAAMFVADFQRAVQHFDAHPITVSLTARDTAIHSHN